MLILGGLAAQAQVNTEKFRKYSDEDGFLFNTLFRFGYSGGNSNYLTVDGTFRLDYNAKKNNAFIVANYDYKETDEGKVVNKGFVHLRGIHPLNDRFSLEGFLQQEFNEFLLLRARQLAGASVRTKLLDHLSKKDSLSSIHSHLGLGGMYEHEAYDVPNEGDLTTVTNRFRISSYLTLDWNISDRISMWMVTYYQPNVLKIHDFRMIMETGMEIWLIGRLYFSIDFSYKYNNEPIGDVEKYDTVIKNGLRYSVP
jgi:hypothetical protein